MSAQTQYNLVKFSYNIILSDAFYEWMLNKEKSFIGCFRVALERNKVRILEDGVDINVPTRDILKHAINSVKSTAVVQMFCYVYELLYKNYDLSLKCDKLEFEKLKSNVFNGPKSYNSEQILNLIRNAISHNDDMDSLSYDYSIISEVFTFLPTKMKKDGSINVTISEDELVDLMVKYMNNMNGYKQLDYVLDVNLEKIKSSKPIIEIDKFINLRNAKTGHVLYPDENQKKVIKDLILAIRNNKIKQFDNINFFYPYKQNVLNNFIRISDFYHMLNCLYQLKAEDFNTFMKKSASHTPSGFTEFKDALDIVGMFAFNRFFQIFSATPLNVIEAKFEQYNLKLNVRKLRNSIMHGTYYKDKELNLYMYDAPREEKTEEQLKFVDKINGEDLEAISMCFFVIKYSGSR